MPHVYVKRGAYADRVLLVGDALAATAIADGWAVDIMDVQEPEEGSNVGWYGDVPDSLANFQENINLGKTSISEGIEQPPVTEPTEPPTEPPAEGGNGGGTPPAPEPVVGTIIDLSNANPAVVTMSATDYAKFANGDSVTVAGTGDAAADGMTATLSGGTPNSFTLDGLDLSALGAPLTAGTITKEA